MITFFSCLMLRVMLYVGMVLSIKISAKTLQNIHVDGLIIVILHRGVCEIRV